MLMVQEMERAVLKRDVISMKVRRALQRSETPAWNSRRDWGWVQHSSMLHGSHAACMHGAQLALARQNRCNRAPAHTALRPAAGPRFPEPEGSRYDPGPAEKGGSRPAARRRAGAWGQCPLECRVLAGFISELAG